MQVVRPPWTRARSQPARCRSRLGTNARTSTPAGACSARGSIRGPATTIMRSSGTRARAGVALQDALDEMRPDAGTSDGHDAHALARLIAEPLTQLRPCAERPRVLANDVAGKLKVDRKS